MNDMMPAREAALMLGVTVHRVYALIAARKLQGERVAGRWWVSASSAARYAEVRCPKGGRPRRGA